MDPGDQNCVHDPKGRSFRRPLLHAPNFGCPFILQTDWKLTLAETKYATAEGGPSHQLALLELRYYLFPEFLHGHRPHSIAVDGECHGDQLKDNQVLSGSPGLQFPVGTLGNADGLSRMWSG